MESTNQFTLFWLDGKREVVSGADIVQAMTHAGYGAGAVRALDFYARGDSNDYEWDASEHGWRRNPNPM